MTWPKLCAWPNQQVCDRFVQAGRKIILRQRAERRLQGVRALMASVGDKAKAAAHVAQELLFGAARNAGLYTFAASSSPQGPVSSDFSLVVCRDTFASSSSSSSSPSHPSKAWYHLTVCS